MKCDAQGCVDGKITLFTTIEDCEKCGGTGRIRDLSDLADDPCPQYPFPKQNVNRLPRKLLDSVEISDIL